jgi:hypothetical protein
VVVTSLMGLCMCALCVVTRTQDLMCPVELHLRMFDTDTYVCQIA